MNGRDWLLLTAVNNSEGPWKPLRIVSPPTKPVRTSKNLTLHQNLHELPGLVKSQLDFLRVFGRHFVSYPSGFFSCKLSSGNL